MVNETTLGILEYDRLLALISGFSHSEASHRDILNLRPIAPWEEIKAYRRRAMNPDHPHLRGSAQNPDHFFQAREAANKYWTVLPEVVAKAMEDASKVLGRSYHLFDYVGAPDAERVLVLMGSGAGAASRPIRARAAESEPSPAWVRRAWRRGASRS